MDTSMDREFSTAMFDYQRVNIGDFRFGPTIAVMKRQYDLWVCAGATILGYSQHWVYLGIHKQKTGEVPRIK